MEKLPKNKHQQPQKKGLSVIGNPLVNKFIASSPPKHLRSNHYPLQATLGITGILLIFMSFRMPVLFFAGALLLFIRRQWRLKTDNHAMNYRNAITALKKKKYTDCIRFLNEVPYDSESARYLDLVKASCYLELEDTTSAYELYKSYFETTPSSNWSDPLYWSAQENAVVLSMEHDNFELAKKIIEHPGENLKNGEKQAQWKAKYKRLINES